MTTQRNCDEQSRLAALQLRKTINVLREALSEAMSEITSLRAEITTLRQEDDRVKQRQVQKVKRPNDLLKNDKRRATRSKAHVDSQAENVRLMKEMKVEEVEWKQNWLKKEWRMREETLSHKSERDTTASQEEDGRDVKEVLLDYSKVNVSSSSPSLDHHLSC
ncbi:hypothetical protein JOB18_002451 [Solea senegalensis]|uniref:Uncharacterized protein n=1 Tax=Solea senegalensis TaxID=28829 RepID=A0AAV6QCR9_SOLSE|nr:hypothetical protein JOB18_002451 [Solea senegalensis]